MRKILAAMSGGVDSAVCCALLARDHFETAGACMLLRPGAEPEAEDARAACMALGVPFHLFRFQEAFSATVEADFCRQYCAGRTPNPCILCNKTIKFGKFLDEALHLGFDGMATGHYARIEHDAGANRWLLRAAVDAAKDQSYMLYSLSQDQLRRSLLPLGGYTKTQVREIAADLGLPVAHKHDSQDVCFIPDGDYRAYLVRSGHPLTPGVYRDAQGNELGPHRGAECYTIGQRRGLGLSCGERVYVTAKPWPDVIVGPNEALFSRRVRVGNVNYIVALSAPRRVRARLRYTPRFAQALLIPTETGAELLFDEPQRAVTPGQAAVFYEDDYVLGGGTILDAIG